MARLEEMAPELPRRNAALPDFTHRLAASLVEGTAGGGMVTVTLSGAGELKAVAIDESLVQPGEGEVLADLVVAAHADAKRKLDQSQAELMKEVAGPLAGMGLPGLKF